MKKIVMAVAAFGLVTGSMPVLAAAPCKDAKGKFVKCPPKPTKAAKPKVCRDKNGKFIKCK